MVPNVSAEVGFATDITIVEIIQTNKIVITLPLDLGALGDLTLPLNPGDHDDG